MSDQVQAEDPVEASRQESKALTRREFMGTAVKLALPAFALLGLGLLAGSGCAGLPTGDGGGGGGGCDGCSGSCQGDCQGTCESTCYTRCVFSVD